MENNFNEKTKIENIACRIFGCLMDCCYRPSFLTQYHKEAQEYYNEFRENFVGSLTAEQKKDFCTLEEINNTVYSTEAQYQLLLGMKMKSAFDELLENPLKILDLYDSRATDIRESYKPAKQKESF